MTRTVTYDETKFAIVPIEPTGKMLRAGDMHIDGISHLGDAWDASIHLTETKAKSAMCDPVEVNGKQAKHDAEEASQRREAVDYRRRERIGFSVG